MKASYLIIIFLFFLFYQTILCKAGDLIKYTNVTFVASPHNDGDSFVIKLGTNNITLRLYYVDCPETGVSQSTDARRVRSQTRYFGMRNHRATVFFGQKAKAFTAEQLSKPFTVYTSMASAPGRSAGGRYYGFVRTAESNDLSTLLVANGLARAYGVARKTPEGIPHDEMTARMKDIESSAMLAHKGIWSESDPEQLVSLRAAERRDMAELEKIRDSIRVHIKPVNINTASKEDLLLLPDIGPAISERIIANRPYTNVNELLKITGITSNILHKIKPHLASIK